MPDNAILLYDREKGARRSASGGGFYAIAKAFLQGNPGAAVYGCTMDENCVTRHIAVSEPEELYRLQGSKYVQSDMGNTFRNVAADLKQGRKVLFSGTPCQVAGLQKFLGKEYENLCTVDIFCHGVPSPGFFREYIGYLEKQYGGKVENFTFRNPGPTDRHGYIIRFTVNGKSYRRFGWEDPYYGAFLGSSSLRPCCYHCPFPGEVRHSDVSLGDSNDGNFHPTEAISLVRINTEKGKALVEAVPDCDMVPTDFAAEARTNHQLTEPAKKPERREKFYQMLHTQGVAALTPKVGTLGRIKTRVKYRIPTKLKRGVRKLLKK